jgi:hypothetical protein
VSNLHFPPARAAVKRDADVRDAGEHPFVVLQHDSGQLPEFAEKDGGELGFGHVLLSVA